MINIYLTFIAIIFIIMYFFIVRFFNKFLKYYIREVKEKEAESKSYMIELINGVDTIRTMNITSSILEKFKYKYDNFLMSSYSLSKVANIQKFISDLIISILIVVIIFVGSHFVIDGKLELGNLITYNSLILYFLEPIKNIVNFDFVIKKSKIIIDRINDLFDIDKENVLFDMNDLKRVDGDIEIKKLSYSYGKNVVLNEVSLKIKKGEKIVICAPSGFGKSTLAKIIARYIKIDKGFVKIGNVDINDYNLWLLREDIAYVSQDEFIFTDSLINNINIRNTRDTQKIMDIMNMTLVNKIVDSRNGDYNMYLKENGSNLSGGEKSRLILARTFLKESNIYILDETFSEIDVKSERIILENIFNKYKDKTIIVITHRNDNNDLYNKVIDLGGKNGRKKL